jgi:beta-glucanase (GH16 family)
VNRVSVPGLTGVTYASVPRLTRRRIISALLIAPAAGVALATAGPVASVTPADAASSWKTNRSFQFSGSDIPDGCGTYGGPYTGGKSYWQADDVRIAGGMLRLRLRERAKNGFAYTSGGLGCWNWPQTYGRFEIRARVPAGRGINSYFTLSPTKGGENGWTGIEVLAPGPETAYITNGHGKASESVRVAGRYADRFHTYVIEWAPKLTRVSVDGRVLFSSTNSYKGPRWPSLVVSTGDALTGVPDDATRLPAEFQIDHIKVAAFTGVAPVVRPTPVVSGPSPGATDGTARVLSAPTPTATPSAAATRSGLLAEYTSANLTGGVWPWLLGGSLVAGLAVVLLSWRRPGGGDDDEPDGDAPRGGDARGRGSRDASEPDRNGGPGELVGAAAPAAAPAASSSAPRQPDAWSLPPEAVRPQPRRSDDWPLDVREPGIRQAEVRSPSPEVREPGEPPSDPRPRDKRSWEGRRPWDAPPSGAGREPGDDRGGRVDWDNARGPIEWERRR